MRISDWSSDVCSSDLMQVSAGSQSFNSVNTLRLLGRWMRMFTIPNQSSVAKAFNEFDEAGRMRPSSYYNRIVDVMEELVRFTVLLRPPADTLVNRYSERKEAGMAIDPSSDLSSIAISGRCGGLWANAGMPVVRFQGGLGNPERSEERRAGKEGASTC